MCDSFNCVWSRTPFTRSKLTIKRENKTKRSKQENVYFREQIRVIKLKINMNISLDILIAYR